MLTPAQVHAKGCPKSRHTSSRTGSRTHRGPASVDASVRVTPESRKKKSVSAAVHPEIPTQITTASRSIRESESSNILRDTEPDSPARNERTARRTLLTGRTAKARKTRRSWAARSSRGARIGDADTNAGSHLIRRRRRRVCCARACVGHETRGVGDGTRRGVGGTQICPARTGAEDHKRPRGDQSLKRMSHVRSGVLSRGCMKSRCKNAQAVSDGLRSAQRIGIENLC